MITLHDTTQLIFTCSKLTIEIVESVKYVQMKWNVHISYEMFLLLLTLNIFHTFF